jgi:hypothetical protein
MRVLTLVFSAGRTYTPVSQNSPCWLACLFCVVLPCMADLAGLQDLERFGVFPCSLSGLPISLLLQVFPSRCWGLFGGGNFPWVSSLHHRFSTAESSIMGWSGVVGVSHYIHTFKTGKGCPGLCVPSLPFCLGFSFMQRQILNSLDWLFNEGLISDSL